MLKFYYLVSDVKLLINMNHLDFFFERINKQKKKLTKLFTPVDVAD